MRRAFWEVLFEVFDICDQRRGYGDIKQVVPIIWGGQGVGKSSIIRQWCDQRKRKFIPLHFGQFDSPGDVLGMPDIEGRGTKSRKTIIAKPDWFPEKGWKSVVFCDEINRANNLVSQLLHPFLLDRMVGQHQIPDDVFIIAAANPPETEFQVNDLDVAVMDRLMHIPMEQDQTGADWLGWANREGVDERIMEFISCNPNLIQSREFAVPRESPTRRSWHMLSLLVNGNDISQEAMLMITNGLLGPVAAKYFLDFSKSQELKAFKILESYENDLELQMKVKVASSAAFRRSDLLAKLCEQLKNLLNVRDLTKEQKSNVKLFKSHLPEEFRASLRFKGGGDV